MNIFNCPRPEHPNPQWERSTWRNLNGKWMFEIDNSKSGENRRLQNADTLKNEIIVPFCPESSLSGIGEKDFMWCVWYKKEIEISDEEIESKRVILHFGAADFITKVWLNGTLVGTPHVGGFGSFSYDITQYLTAGKNIITVACYDETKSHDQPRGKQADNYYSAGCHYTRTTGIWQTVWLEFVPETHIKFAKIIPDLKNSTVTIDAELAGRGDFSAEAYFEGRLVGSASKKNLAVTGTLEIKLNETHAWEIGDGKLYDLYLRFGSDEVKSYFGLRDVSLENGKFILNGRSVFQRFVLDQGYYHDGIMTAPTEEHLVRDIEISMSAGFNGARLHQKVFEPRYLYHADRLGYMVWGEYGSWGMNHSNIANLAIFMPDWIATVRQNINHPSIVTWCPFNENADYSTKRFRQNDDLVRIVYEQTKICDPTRPCTDVSGWYHVKTDIYDIHDYTQDASLFKERYDRLYTENSLYDAWGENGTRQRWRGEPVCMSEYGGIALGADIIHQKAGTNTEAWGYGDSAKSLEEYYDRYKALTDALLDNPRLFGFCYTQLYDIEQEQNGLYTYEGREPKVDISVIADINRRKAAIED